MSEHHPLYLCCAIPVKKQRKKPSFFPHGHIIYIVNACRASAE